jgi:hypothetical protein
VDSNCVIRIAPESILEQKLIPWPQGDISIPVVCWLIKWINQPIEAAVWEDAAFIQKVFSDFQP